MINSTITLSHQNYLKAIYLLCSKGRKATNSAIAEALAVAPASATNMVKRLADMELIVYEPYQGVQLTPEGERIALEMVRHHRLIELFLHDILEMPWDQVHADAERLEHVISEEMEDAISRKLGSPRFDPHGDPIPDKNGVKAEIRDRSLAELEAGRLMTLARVRAQDGEQLRYLGSLGLYPGVQVMVVDRAPFDGPLTLLIAGRRHALAFELAKLLFVSDPEQTP